jgi:hypothetical protein
MFKLRRLAPGGRSNGSMMQEISALIGIMAAALRLLSELIDAKLLRRRKMRSYTEFRLDVKEFSSESYALPQDTIQKLEAAFKELDNKLEINTENRYFEAFGLDTWICYEKDMIELSKAFPNLLFELNGLGLNKVKRETYVWRHYYKDGIVQKCSTRTVFEPLNETLFTKK